MPVSLSEADAATPAAIAEHLSDTVAEVRVFDYLTSGQLIRLAKGERLVLGCLTSRRREVIVGGTVTVGVMRKRRLVPA